jgi:hypothetical protein
MAQALVVEQSRAVPIAQADAFTGTVPVPLDELFCRRYGPIPAIKAVRDQSGTWDSVGQTRTIVLSGGGSMVETLTSYDEPRSFGYALSDIKGPMAPLAGAVRGEWLFEPLADGTGTKITWRWTVHPRTGLSAPLLPVFGRLWKGYAAQSLARLSDLLVG